MVKWPWSRESKTKGAFAPGLSAKERLQTRPTRRYIYHIGDRIYAWPQQCEEYDKYYNDHPEVKSQVLSIAGRATAKGIFLEPQGEDPRDEAAAELCDDLNAELGMDQLLYETIIPLVKYGTVLWEKTLEPSFACQLIPIVADYKPVEFEFFHVSRWEILERGQSRRPKVILSSDQCAEYSWNVTSTSWPYGTSLLAGLGQTLEITERLIDDLEEYMHKAAFPGGLFQIGEPEDRPDATEMSDIQAKIKNWEPGDNYATSYNVDYKVVGPASAETRMMGETLQFLKDRMIDGLMVPPLSKQYQRTEASAEEMTDATFQGIILPVQRLLKRVLERQIYFPFLETHGFSIRNVPSVSFHPPDEDRDEQADYYMKLVRSGIMTKEAAARELGVRPEDVPVPIPIVPAEEEEPIAEGG